MTFDNDLICFVLYLPLDKMYKEMSTKKTIELEKLKSQIQFMQENSDEMQLQSVIGMVYYNVTK